MVDVAAVEQPAGGDIASSLLSKLEKGRIELLDLSTRNRLIHTPRGSKIKAIEVVDEITPEIFRLLVTEGKAFSFAAGRSAAGQDATAVGDADLIAELAQPENDSVDERGVFQRHSDNQLQTRLTSEGLQKRLFTMYLDAKTLQEEQGVNILFLALGALKWFEDKNSEKERFAPLILVPVSLERGNASERFKIRWLNEDIAPNLSLAALLKRQFGLELPQFAESDDAFDPSAYLDRVADAIAGQHRWQVLPNDMVLGFFSFSKFLMYRDLDPESWPNNAALSQHPVVAGLLGDGFPAGEALLSEDNGIDPHIPPSDLIHIVDADSSQTLAIHEVRRGRHLVVQGPPGTGKSQTIANVIASAVTDGKKVLFVAEKMAALEVVKRRLDAAGVGDVCLELHSNKANKRQVLEELRRTWDLGRPYGNEDAALLRHLQQYRDALNAHAVRLHKRHHCAGLSPYQVVGHLVRLKQLGQKPSDITLVQPGLWTRADKEERELLLTDIAARIDSIGLPEQHPWRGVELDALLPTETDRLAVKIKNIQAVLHAITQCSARLGVLIGVNPPENLSEAANLSFITARIAGAPNLESAAITDECWFRQREEITEAIASGQKLASLRGKLTLVWSDIAWDTDVKTVRQAIAVHGASWLRWINGDYRKALNLLRSILTVPLPKAQTDRISLLDNLIVAQKLVKELADKEVLTRKAYGSAWRGERSNWQELEAAAEWFAGNGEIARSKEISRLTAPVQERGTVGQIGAELHSLSQSLSKDMEALASSLKLNLKAAFSISSLENIPFSSFIDRVNAWIDRAEELSKWIAYRSKTVAAAEAGLSDIVRALESGMLNTRSVINEFEMAYYDALLSDMAKSDPEIARFDGDAQNRAVDEFRKLDRKRIELARKEVAAAHHAKLPRLDGGAGPLGVLKGEIARRRGHMPIRQLMKRAGPAIQALKPVFMMSPLSVAQFLEPGALDFDLLVIDEASQIQPVDALGAIARCGQIVVVGDDRQLPPTRFFDKVIAGDDSDDDDGSAGVGDVESILGLCVSKGLPQRMLRWHYRSRHQSLIAVSNSQFYENKLYIVPSPYTQQAGMGLRFHHLPHATFDSGNTATNVEEAKAVAESIIRHAKEHPNLSLGVATFSTKQRGAVWDELERLRRLNPDTEPFFSSHPAEPFFIKNLENVQGDERDVIFISVGYGRNPQGYMAMRFGPLSSEGGERRLNVLISRAKRRCEVFSSITNEDIDLERGRGKGVVAFKLFLHFARTGRLSIGNKTDREHDSVFEEQVAKALRDYGYDVHPQVGLAGFFIDLAVADVEKPGRYILGIECDGAAYHSSKSARDRDRLRQAVLEDHGWIIHRIWSTDWFNRPQDQLKKVLAAIEEAKAELMSRDAAAFETSKGSVLEIVTVDREDVSLVGLMISESDNSLTETYQEAKFDVPQHTEIHDVPTGTMASLLKRIVELEGPIHRSEVVTRIRTLWGLQRAGNRIQAAVDRGIDVILREKSVAESAGFLALAGAPIRVRNRLGVSSLGLRKPEMLPPMEVKEALVRFLRAHFGATEAEAINGISRLLGFKATSAQLKEVIEAAIAASIAEGRIRRSVDLLVVVDG